MKRILLPALLIGILLLSACGGLTTAPGAETAPEPAPESEEAPDYTRWIASELQSLNQAMLQFATTYPIFPHVFDEEVGEVLVHKFTISGAGYWYFFSYAPATSVSEAKTHIENAYWLTNKGKLPDEAMARDVRTDEITQEVSDAINLLEQQVSYSYSYQADLNEWVNDPANITLPTIQPNKETMILDIAEICDEYRAELSKIIPKLELILSRLPSDEWYQRPF